jgi:hypothetical protein
MNKELSEASTSSIKWLAGTFNVPLELEKERDVPTVPAVTQPPTITLPA